MKRSFVLALVLLLSAAGARADVMLLVHGYLGSGASWHESGVSYSLEQAGWGYAGHLQPVNGQMRLRYGRYPNADKAVFTVDLPSEAPVDPQMRWLAAAVDQIQQRRPNERFVLVGHSAGGVVARLFLVRVPDRRVDVLVTIASPHLGTDLAETGASLANSPVGFFAPMMGLGEINRGEALYRDLSRPRPGSLLYWLNTQPHPDIDYISMIREPGLDEVVPLYSQDLNNVPVLRGRARSYRTVGDHYLNKNDGAAIAGALEALDH